MIINTSTKKQTVKNIKVITHKTKDIRTGDNIEKEYVQYTVIGQNSEWIDWMLLSKFKELNPGIL